MISKIATTLFLVCASIASFAQQKDTSALISRAADIGLVYPLSTNGADAAHYSNKLSLQAIAGVSGSITGCGIAGIANIVRQDAYGCLLAGVLNRTGDQARGSQFAGVVNLVQNNTKGIQAAGILNQSGSVNGVQLAGFANIIHENSKAVQIAGLYNRAANTQSQISGFLNVAKKVTGIQLSGFINIADSSDYAIGFINIIKHGEKSIGLSIDETKNTELSFYSGGRYLYGIIGLGYRPKSDDDVYTLQAGLGAHLLQPGGHFRLNAAIIQRIQTDFSHGHCYTYALHVLPEVKIHQRFALFAGPTANLQLDYSNRKISSAVKHYLWTTKGPSGHFIGSYIGVTGGLKVIL